MNIRRKATALGMMSALCLVAPALAEGSHWAYEGHAGPSHWSSLGSGKNMGWL